MDSLGSLQTFVRVADARSFVDAGRSLGVTAAAVGKAIARLEQDMGVRLFHRSTRSVALTAEGQLFLVRCRRILTEAEAAKAELSERLGTAQGRLRISLPTVNDLTLPLLAEFAKRYPDVVLDLDFTDRVVDVIDEGFDAVIRVGKPTDSRLAGRYLGSFNRHLIASPAYLQAHGEPKNRKTCSPITACTIAIRARDDWKPGRCATTAPSCASPNPSSATISRRVSALPRAASASPSCRIIRRVAPCSVARW